MQLYARIFTKILDSSLAEDWQTRVVFQDLLLLAEDGIVDMTHSAISRRTNVPLEIVTASIQKLESVDARSRDPQDDGRRIKRLDDHRDWGWQIVNWEKYEGIRTLADQRQKNAERKAKSRSKWKEQELPLTPPSPPPSPDSEPTPTPEGHACHSDWCDGSVTGKVITPEEIYQHYPRKEDRKEGIKAIIKAMQANDPQLLLDRCIAYELAVKTWLPEDLHYVPYPATWFNKARFLDNPESWKRASTAGGKAQNIASLQKKIDEHPANPQWAGFYPGRHTEAQTKEFQVMKAELSRLKSA